MKVVSRHEGVAMGRHEGGLWGDRQTDLVLDASLPKHKNVRSKKLSTKIFGIKNCPQNFGQQTFLIQKKLGKKEFWIKSFG